MYVGACRLNFLLPGNRSLKGKRQVVRRICDRLRHKFHVAAAEVGDPEQWSEAEIGFAVVSGNPGHARAMAENILGFLESMMIAPLRDLEVEVISFDDFLGRGIFSASECRTDAGEAKLGHWSDWTDEDPEEEE